MNGNPTKSGSAFGGVFAAALANKGSFHDIRPGLDFFAKVKKAGELQPGGVHPGHGREGRDPDQHRLGLPQRRLRRRVPKQGCGLEGGHPPDGQYAQYYYSQAINKDAPHPAAARLWEEYLYSAEGQNLFLKGYARPALMPSMTRSGTVDSAAAANLPHVDGAPSFPSDAQLDKAKQVVAQGWGKAVAG